jgi:hypothetical protein
MLFGSISANSMVLAVGGTVHIFGGFIFPEEDVTAELIRQRLQKTFQKPVNNISTMRIVVYLAPEIDDDVSRFAQKVTELLKDSSWNEFDLEIEGEMRKVKAVFEEPNKIYAWAIR